MLLPTRIKVRTASVRSARVVKNAQLDRFLPPLDHDRDCYYQAATTRGLYPPPALKS